jgi:DnaJ-class molecular chaperone
VVGALTGVSTIRDMARAGRSKQCRYWYGTSRVISKLLDAHFPKMEVEIDDSKKSCQIGRERKWQLPRNRQRSIFRSCCLLLWIAFLSSKFISVAAGKSYYDILGVPKGSSGTDIKKAYFKLALKHHPDKGGDEEKFKEISEAFECLSSPEKRDLYDHYGQAGVANGGPTANSFPFGSAGGGNPFGAGGNPFGGSGEQRGGPFPSFCFNMPGQGSYGGQNRNNNIDLSEILQKMMAQSNAFQSSSPPHPPPPPPPQTYSKPVTCTLEDLARGVTKKMKVTYQGQEKIFEIQIKKGWKEGTKISFPGKTGGYPTMTFIVRQAPHKYLRREGNDLFYTCWIDERQTQGGFKVNIPLPSGEAWSKTIPRGQGRVVVSNGEKIVVPSRGMVIKGGPDCGDLIIEFRVRRSMES